MLERWPNINTWEISFELGVTLTIFNTSTINAFIFSHYTCVPILNKRHCELYCSRKFCNKLVEWVQRHEVKIFLDIFLMSHFSFVPPCLHDVDVAMRKNCCLIDWISHCWWSSKSIIIWLIGMKWWTMPLTK